MRYYETIYIVDPNLENTILEKTMTEIGEELQKTKAKIINHRDWGKKRLAYQVSNQKYGTFILLQFEIEDLNKMKEFDSSLKLNNLVLRHMTVSLDRKPKEYVDKSKTDSSVIENDSVSSSEQNKDGDDKATTDGVENNLDSNTVKIDEEK
jgi:small subunit ribosomal protein S6|tara:strand:+ start:444 stop:896 length:453 start_codon:yes stop_codon:yes gene_type:complete